MLRASSHRVREAQPRRKAPFWEQRRAAPKHRDHARCLILGHDRLRVFLIVGL